MKYRTDFMADDPRLPERRPVEGVTACGLLLAMQFRFWYRQNAPALTNSPVPWDPEGPHPFVVEIDMIVPDRDDPDRWIPVTITHPCSHGPGSPEFAEAIRAATQRALCHEGDEGLLINGVRTWDPHR